jgi:hypothetical protein
MLFGPSARIGCPRDPPRVDFGKVTTLAPGVRSWAFVRSILMLIENEGPVFVDGSG